MARLRALPVTIDTVPTSVLILDQATPDQVSMINAAPTEALQAAGIPLLAFPFEVQLPTDHTNNSDHNLALTAAQAQTDQIIDKLHDLNTAPRTRRTHES